MIRCVKSRIDPHAAVFANLQARTCADSSSPLPVSKYNQTAQNTVTAQSSGVNEALMGDRNIQSARKCVAIRQKRNSRQD
jgi:hypothetical protein